MTHDVSPLLDTPAPTDGLCTLSVTLRDSRGALGRIAASLSSMPVLALSYAVVDARWATAEIRLPRACAGRARGRLNRMVDVLTVDQRPDRQGFSGG